jgi:CRISPR/Cas system-associated exonuclease Cas4 (RecB family)
MKIEEIEALGFTPRFPEVIDSSMLSDFARCPSMFYLRHVLGVRRKSSAGREALDWGSKWHELLEEWWKAAQEGLSPQAAAVKAITVALAEWPESIVGETDRHGRTRERMAKLFLRYVERYAEEDLKHDILRAEQFFDFEDETLGLRWCGRMDQVRRIRGKIRGWDFKTTSMMGPNYFDTYEYSFQLPGYVIALSQIMTEPVDGIVLDVLYTLKSSDDFFRRTIKYSPERLAEWVSNTKQYLSDMYRMRDSILRDPEAWHKNWTNCTLYAGCQFRSIHFFEPDSRARILADEYYEDRWDPRNEEKD